MLSKLRDDILRLLKEDEEFRYAVIGLLGLHRLEEAITKLTEVIVKMESRLDSLENIIARQEERLTKLEYTVSRLAEIQAIQEERLTKLMEAISKLVDITAKLEYRITIVEDKLTKVENTLAGVENRLTTVEASMGTLGRRVGKDLEKMILKIYKEQLIQLGINPEKAKRFRYIDKEGKYGRKGKEYEFDIVISDEHTDVLEVKTRTKKEDVEWFLDNVESIKSLFDKPLRRKVIVTVHIDDDALIKANELGIDVIYGNIIKE